MRKSIVLILLILLLVSGCASAGFRSVAGFSDALYHGAKLKQGTALSPSMSSFGVGFGILEGVLFGISAIASKETPTISTPHAVTQDDHCDSSDGREIYCNSYEGYDNSYDGYEVSEDGHILRDEKK